MACIKTGLAYAVTNNETTVYSNVFCGLAHCKEHVLSITFDYVNECCEDHRPQTKRTHECGQYIFEAEKLVSGKASFIHTPYFHFILFDSNIIN